MCGGKGLGGVALRVVLLLVGEGGTLSGEADVSGRRGEEGGEEPERCCVG